jgi:hypothetical protein
MRRMRRRIVIGIVAAASLGGSLSAHVAGALTRSEAPDTDGAGHAASGFVPVMLATAFVVLLAVWLSRRLPGRAFAVVCAAPFVASALQEQLERLLSTESSPFGSGREPGLISAAIALLPWAVAVFVMVRVFVALARVARTSAVPSIMLVPPAVGSDLAPTEVRRPRELHDPILDRPPRAPPSPRRLAAV